MNKERDTSDLIVTMKELWFYTRFLINVNNAVHF